MAIKHLFVCVVAVTQILLVSCSLSSTNNAAAAIGNDVDCGLLATFAKPDDTKKVAIRFWLVTAEILNGHANCGFGRVPKRVQKAQLNGNDLSERAEGSDHYYDAPAGFDWRKDILKVELDGKTYASNPAVEPQGTDTITVPLRPEAEKTEPEAGN